MVNNNRKEYINRINKVVDFIEANLASELSLNTIANIAHFSPFHFHRIFTVLMGETLNNYIKRARLERAAQMLIYNPECIIADITHECGFKSDAVFCRAFKEKFGVTAKVYKKQWEKQKSKKGQSESKNGKFYDKKDSYFCDVNLIFKNTEKMKNIEVKEMQAMNLIYCRHTGQFNQIGKAYEKLMRWAGPRGLIQFPKTKMLTVYHDDPNVTAIEKVRQSACISVEKDVKAEGEIGNMSLPGGKYVVGKFEIDETGFQGAWDSVCRYVIDSGYQPCGNPFELYHNNHQDHPEKKFIMDICIPVKPL